MIRIRFQSPFTRRIVGFLGLFTASIVVGGLLAGPPPTSRAQDPDEDQEARCEDDACVHIHRRWWFDSHFCGETDGSRSGCDLDSGAEGGCTSYPCDSA